MSHRHLVPHGAARGHESTLFPREAESELAPRYLCDPNLYQQGLHDARGCRPGSLVRDQGQVAMQSDLHHAAYPDVVRSNMLEGKGALSGVDDRPRCEG